jgi:hypothetical protein
MGRAISTVVPVAIAIVAGILAWDLVRLIGGRREAWDDPNYWVVGYPLMLGAALMLGLGFPERPWRWAVVIVAAQAVWALFLGWATDGSVSLFPVGLAMFAVLALPCVVAAYAGQWLARRLAA